MTQQQQRLAAQGEAPKKGIFSQLSMPAVLAAVLTSATSFMLSSKIGLAGSLIGAVVVSAVSTISSQVYNAMINASVDKLHDLSDQMQATAPMHLDAGATRPAGLTDAKPTRAVRNTFVVAVMTALIALIAYGAVIDIATQGEGLGPVSSTQPVAQDTQVSQTDTEANEGEATAEAAKDATVEEPKQQDAAVVADAPAQDQPLPEATTDSETIAPVDPTATSTDAPAEPAPQETTDASAETATTDSETEH